MQTFPKTNRINIITIKSGTHKAFCKITALNFFLINIFDEIVQCKQVFLTGEKQRNKTKLWDAKYKGLRNACEYIIYLLEAIVSH